MSSYQSPDNFYGETTSVNFGANPWLGLAGPVNTKNAHILNSGVNLETPTLPQAYDGQSKYMGTTIENLMLLSTNFMGRVLPLRFTDDISHTWNVWQYSPQLFDRETELAPPRVTTARREGRRAESRRWGQGIRMEDGYANTGEGRIALGLAIANQIRNMMLTIEFSGLFELFNCKNHYREANYRRGGACRTIADIMDFEVKNFARVQKTPGGKGLALLDKEWTALMAKNDVIPTVYIAPPDLMALNQKSNINLQTDGEQALRNLNNQMPVAGLQGRFPPGAPDGKDVYGLTAQTFDFTTVTTDLSKRAVQIGGYFRMCQFFNCVDNTMWRYNTCMSNTKILNMDEPGGVFQEISQEEMIDHCERFNVTSDGKLSPKHRELISNDANMKFADVDMLNKGEFADIMLYYEKRNSTRGDRENRRETDFMEVSKFGQMDLKGLNEDALAAHGKTASDHILECLSESDRRAYREGQKLMRAAYTYRFTSAVADFFKANAAANVNPANDTRANQTRRNEFGCEDIIADFPPSANGVPIGCGTPFWFQYLAQVTRDPDGTFHGISNTNMNIIRDYEAVLSTITAKIRMLYPEKYNDALKEIYCPDWCRTGDKSQAQLNTLFTSVLDYAKPPVWVRLSATNVGPQGGQVPLSAANTPLLTVWKALAADLGASDADASAINASEPIRKLLAPASGQSAADKAAAVRAQFDTTLGPLAVAGKVATVPTLADFYRGVGAVLTKTAADQYQTYERVAVWNQLARYLNGTDATKSKLSANDIRSWVSAAKNALPPPGASIPANGDVPALDASVLASIGASASSPSAIANTLVQTSFVVDPHVFWQSPDAMEALEVFPSNPLATTTPIVKRQDFVGAREKFPARKTLHTNPLSRYGAASGDHYSSGYQRMSVGRDAFGSNVSGAVPASMYAAGSLVINNNFTTRWAEIETGDAGDCDLVRTCKLLLCLSDVNSHLLKNWLRHNVIVPFDFIGLRPYRRYVMHSMLLLRPGSALGNTLVGHLDCQMGNDVKSKELFIHTTMYMGTIIRSEKNVAIIENVYCSGYNGGEGITFFTPSIFKGNDQTSYKADIFAVLLPYGTANPKKTHPYAISSVIDVSGVTRRGLYERRIANNAVSQEEMRRPNYPSYIYTRFLYKFHRYDRVPAYDCDERYSTELSRRNTLCFQEPQQVYDPASGRYTLNILGQGHWGSIAFDGIARYRCGEQEAFPEYIIPQSAIL